MDISDEYAKMCDCAEIQSLWFPAFGDYYLRRGFSFSILPECLICVSVLSKLKAQSIWLPRQDQLQEMLNMPTHTLIYSLDKFCRSDSGFFDTHGSDYSMEQMWLILVMSELHGKRWNGGAWVK